VVRIERQRIFRRKDRRRVRGCSSCLHGKICQVFRFIQAVGTHIRVLECRYFASKKLSGNYRRIAITTQKDPVFSLKTLVEKVRNVSNEPIKERWNCTLWGYRDHKGIGYFFKR